jgi:hypothetical protein
VHDLLGGALAKIQAAPSLAERAGIDGVSIVLLFSIFTARRR